MTVSGGVEPPATRPVAPAPPPVSRHRRVRTPTVLQMEAVECGAASLAMVLAAHGRYVPLEELRVVCGVSRDGASLGNIARAARRHGLTAQGKRVEPDRLRTLPLPLIAHWGFNHFLVIEGFAGDEWLLNDPATGRRRVSNVELSSEFTGMALVLEPGPDFVRGGQGPGAIGPLWALLRGLGAGVAFVLVVSLGLALPGVAVPALVRSFVDGYVVGGTTAWLGPLLVGLLLAACTSTVLTWLQQKYLLRLEAKIALGTAGRFFWHVLRLPVEFYTQRSAGEVSSRVDVVDQLARLVSGELATAALNVATIGFFAVVMLFYDRWLTLVALGAAAINFIALRLVAGRRADASARLQRERGKVMATAMRGLQIIETLKATATEGDFFSRWAGHYARLADAEQELGLSSRVLAALPTLLAALALTAVLAVGGWRVLHHDLTVGVLVAFQMLTTSMLRPVGQLVALGSSLQEVQGSLRRLQDVLDHRTDRQALVGARPSNDAPLDSPELLKLEGLVELRGVTFGYNRNEPPLLDKLDLTIAPGRRVAIVGGSGSGKSTVARLVCGLFEPWEGEVLLDGQPRLSIPRDLVARSVALVDQEIFLLEGTVRENIALWDPTMPDTRVLAAARDAAVHADVAARPGGYESPVEEGGRNFSGGQRQRLEIARALVLEPSILVLDEATSALDPVTELRIDAAIRRRGCSTLVVAHRLSTIRDADEIVFLDRGRIAERGTHDELLAMGGHYARLVHAEEIEDAAVKRNILSAMTGEYAVALPDGRATDVTAPPADEVERERLRRFADWEQDAPRRVALRFAGAVDQTRSAFSGPLDPGASELLRAAQRVGEAAGVDVAAPSHVDAGPAPADAIERIARASRLRVRRVRLPEAWWGREVGPFVGQLAAESRPVALIPRADRGYLLFDPRTGTETVVGARLAGQLEPTGHVLYRPLPARAVSLRELITFGGRGTASDAWRAAIAGLLAGATALAMPLGAGALVGRVIPLGDEHGLVALTLVLGVAALASALATVIRSIAMLRMETRFDSAVQSAVWDRLLRLPTTFFRRHSAGELAMRAMGVTMLRPVLADAVSAAAFNAVAAVVSGLLLFALAPALAVVAVTIVLAGAGAAFVVQRRQLQHERALAEVRGRVAGLVLQLLTGITRLRVAAAELRAFELWAGGFALQRRLALEARRAANAITVFAPVWPVLTITAIVAAVTVLRSPSPGPFVAFFVALEQFTAGMAGLVLVLSPVTRAVPYLERLRPLLECEPEAEALGADPGALAGAVEVASASFRYDAGAPLVLDTVSIRAEPGQFVAVVGPSGSGKSSLFRLLLGFERPESGSIYYDAQDLAQLDVSAVRRQLGVVLQTGALVPGDILTNIIGESMLTTDDAWNAAREAGLEEDIRRMPMGMFTVIGEGASTISGGQRQRILIARALARRPRVLLFDEATSALDNATQEVVSASLDRLRTTRIVIAHRLSTIQHADVIYVIDRGRVVQSGRFEELMVQEGLFADLARRQLA